MAKRKGPDAAREKEWQAECDLHTLIDAQKIMQDKARFAAAMAKQQEMKASLDAVAEEADEAKVKPAKVKKMAMARPTANIGAY
jgi:hypothetical protein